MSIKSDSLEILRFCASQANFSQNEKDLPVILVVDEIKVEINGLNNFADGSFVVTMGMGLPLIKIAKNTRDLAWVVTHEWVHFLQWIRGDLRFDLATGEAFYLGKNIKDFPYHSRPEEKEAREIGENLWRAWNRQKRG